MKTNPVLTDVRRVPWPGYTDKRVEEIFHSSAARNHRSEKNDYANITLELDLGADNTSSCPRISLVTYRQSGACNGLKAI